MCFGDDGTKKLARQQQTKADKQDREMKAAEKKRQGEIKKGKSGIDYAYSGYNDEYYGNYAKAYENYYLPELAEQFNKAWGDLNASLAGRGLLDSSVGASALSDLSAQNEKEKVNISNKGKDASNTLKSNVEKSKSDLYALNASSADSSAVSNRAIGEAASLAGQPTYDTMGQVFASALDPWVSYARNRSSQGSSYGSGYSRIASGSGSQTVLK